MGKRSNFDRRPQDAYDTPREAVLPLVPHLPRRNFDFWEPCAGAGHLATHVFMAGDDMGFGWFAPERLDIAPRSTTLMKQGDALECEPPRSAQLIITNPPWTREILHPMIERFAHMRPAWLLFDADWMHTKQAAPYLPLCRKIVSVGRVKWIPDSPHTGKDNCAWYLFDATGEGAPEFVGRAA